MRPHAATLQTEADQSALNNRRRSLRIPSSVPLIMSGFKPYKFSECCGTVTVSAHGCQIRSFRPLKVGMQVRLHAIDVDRVADATVIHVEGIEEEPATRVWNCGLALDRPGNFWGILSPPCDWSGANGPGANSAARPVSAPDPPRRMPGDEDSPVRPGLPSQDLQQMVLATKAALAGLEARMERSTAEFESGALTRLQQSFGEAIKQGQDRMKRYAEACGESRLVDLEAELERRLEPFVSRSQTAIETLERLLETIRGEQSGYEARMAQWRQYEDQLRGWLAEEAQRFHGQIHDAMVEATGQVKGRIDEIIRTACEPLERRVQDARAQLETLTLRQTDELGRRGEAELERLGTIQEDMDRLFGVRLATRQAEALDQFQRQAKDSMVQAIARMQQSLDGALRSVDQAFQAQPAASLTLPAEQDRHGNEPAASL